MTHSAAGNPEDPASTHPYLEGEFVLLSSPYQESRIVTSESISQHSFMTAQLCQTLGLSSLITLLKRLAIFLPSPAGRQLFLAKESLVSGILAEDGKIDR
jgi:hypothetical protein